MTRVIEDGAFYRKEKGGALTYTIVVTNAGPSDVTGASVTDLLTAASLHASICLKRSLFLEFNVSASPVLRDIIHNPIVLDKDGTLTVPEGPGLGIDEDAINCYRIA